MFSLIFICLFFIFFGSHGTYHVKTNSYRFIFSNVSYQLGIFRNLHL